MPSSNGRTSDGQLKLDLPIPSSAQVTALTRCCTPLGPVGSGILAPFPLAGEQVGEPLALLWAQARNEGGEGVGVSRFLACSATSWATSRVK